MLPQATTSTLHSGRSQAIVYQQHIICHSGQRQQICLQPLCSQQSSRTPVLGLKRSPHQQQRAVRMFAAPQGAATSTTKGESVAVPPPSSMQATVTLVPKKNASTALLKQVATPSDDPIGKFLLKCKLAWNLFFPPQADTDAAAPTPNLSPKELGKQRLQMILVADRCGLSPSSLVEMKRNTLAALSECMELEDLQDAHLRFTMTREGGTTYSMAVPILRGGPYTDDGDVVGQTAPGKAASAAMAAAAAAAGFHYDDDDTYEGEEDGLLYDDDYSTASTARSPAPPSPLGSVDIEEDLQQQQGRSASSSPAPAAAVHDSGSSTVADDIGVFKEQLKEMLVEELVHDVEELAKHKDGINSNGAVLQAATPSDESAGAVALPQGVVVDGASGVLSEQELRVKAELEVQRLLKERDGGSRGSAVDEV